MIQGQSNLFFNYLRLTAFRPIFQGPIGVCECVKDPGVVRRLRQRAGLFVRVDNPEHARKYLLPFSKDDLFESGPKSLPQAPRASLMLFRRHLRIRDGK
jgi:hypothetical protein